MYSEIENFIDTIANEYLAEFPNKESLRNIIISYIPKEKRYDNLLKMDIRELALLAKQFN